MSRARANDSLKMLMKIHLWDKTENDEIRKVHDTLGNNSGSSDFSGHFILFLYHSKFDIIKVKLNRVKSQFIEKPWLRNLVYEREIYRLCWSSCHMLRPCTLQIELAELEDVDIARRECLVLKELRNYNRKLFLCPPQK